MEAGTARGSSLSYTVAVEAGPPSPRRPPASVRRSGDGTIALVRRTRPGGMAGETTAQSLPVNGEPLWSTFMETAGSVARREVRTGTPRLSLQHQSCDDENRPAVSRPEAHSEREDESSVVSPEFAGH